MLPDYWQSSQMSGCVAPLPTPIAVTPSSATIANSLAASSVIATLSCTMSDASACPGTATFSVTGTSSPANGNVQVSGTQLQTANANIPTGTYTGQTLHVTANSVTANT